MDRDQVIIEASKYFEELRIPVVLVSSSLLGLVREGRLLGNDVNFACDVNRLTEDKLRQIREGEHFSSESDSVNKPGIISFDFNGSRVELEVFWKYGNRAYFNPRGDWALVYYYDDICEENWETIEYKGNKYNVPGNPDHFLTSYYGNWQTPKEDWQWMWSPNLSKISKINRNVVYTGGTFDLFHGGHANFLMECSKLGEVVVSLNTDDFIEKFKGHKPVMTFKERKDVLLSCKWVSRVIENTGGQDSKPAILTVRPNIIAIGDDWKDKDYFKQMDFTQAWLDENGIELVYIPYTKDISSTIIKKRICDIS